MFHHDQRDYAEAASAAAQHGRTKMEEIIHQGQASAREIVERIQGTVITDRVVKAVDVRLHVDGGGWALNTGDAQLPFHSHAFGQVCEDAGVPGRYVGELVKQANGTPWGKILVAHNVNEILSHRKEQRNLIRAEGGGLVKGWLSDKFRRLDSRPLLDAFMGGCTQLGLLPIEGVATDTKCRVRAVLPKVFEPLPNEVMLFGLEWGNSDFGDGGHVVSLWTMRVWCTNLAMGQQCLRQIHLGKRLADDIAYSQQTYELDTRTNASALKDVVYNAIGPARVNAALDHIKAAGEQKLGDHDSVEKLLKASFEKADAERILALYEGPDQQNLPAGNTAWRLSNAASFFAQTEGLSTERKLEIQQAAGKLAKLTAGSDKAVAV